MTLQLLSPQWLPTTQDKVRTPEGDFPGPLARSVPTPAASSHTCAPAQLPFCVLLVLCFSSPAPLHTLVPHPGSPFPWGRGECMDNASLSPNPISCFWKAVKTPPPTLMVGPSTEPMLCIVDRKASQLLLCDEEAYAGSCVKSHGSCQRHLGGRGDLWESCPVSLKHTLLGSLNVIMWIQCAGSAEVT